jgi:hypothetical protein
MAGSQKLTVWGPERTPLGILRVKDVTECIKMNILLYAETGLQFS